VPDTVSGLVYVLTDRYKQHHQIVRRWYDEMSELPLRRPNLQRSDAQPYNDYFNSQVRKSHIVESVLQQWQCRSRVLLLVFPPLGDMVYNAATSYVDVSPPVCNDTIVYVGEGRGGANADDAFFD
jgi:hypothetical protein